MADAAPAIRQRFREHRLSAKEVRGLNRDKAVYSSLQNLREGEKKTYERSLLTSEQIQDQRQHGLAGDARAFWAGRGA
jgi:hypothetical protein